MNEHLGERAELYAMGMLDALERAVVHAHVASCSECLHALGEAEAAVASLTGSLPSYAAPERAPRVFSSTGLDPAKPRPASRRWAAIAASFVAGILLLSGAYNLGSSANHAGDADDRARLAMTTSHFAHLTLAPAMLGAPAAKAIYSRESGWLYVTVASPRGNFRVRVRRTGADVTSFVLRGAGSTETGFSSSPGARAGDSIELDRDGALIARGELR